MQIGNVNSSKNIKENGHKGDNLELVHELFVPIGAKEQSGSPESLI